MNRRWTTLKKPWNHWFLLTTISWKFNFMKISQKEGASYGTNHSKRVWVRKSMFFYYDHLVKAGRNWLWSSSSFHYPMQSFIKRQNFKNIHIKKCHFVGVFFIPITSNISIKHLSIKWYSNNFDFVIHDIHLAESWFYRYGKHKQTPQTITSIRIKSV